MAEKNERAIKVVAENRKARFNYAIEDTVEAGIALTGTEVKSIRGGKSTIAESYADSRNGEIWLINANIPEYLQANRFNHEPKRPRKLLLHKKQINKLLGAVDREIPIMLGKRLFDAAPEPKQFVEVPTGGHEDLDKHGAVAIVRKFIANLASGSEASAGT